MTDTELFTYNNAVANAAEALDNACYGVYNQIMCKFKGNRKQALRRKLVERGHEARIIKAEELSK